MKARKPLVVGLLVASLGLFAWRSSRQPSQKSRVEEDTSDTSSDLSTLRAEVVELKARQKQEMSLLVAKTLSSAVATAAPQEEAVTEQQKAAKTEQTNARIADTLAQKIQSERIDVNWSATTSAEIRTVLKTSLPGTEVMDAQCASTLCRVVVRHVEKGDQTTLAHKVAHQEPFSQGTFLRYDMQSDPPTTTMFILRDGQVPPEVSNL